MTAPEPKLTAGQAVVLLLTSTGHSYRTAGKALGISENAARCRARNAQKLLGTHHVTHTYAEALRRGLLEENTMTTEPATGVELIAAERARQIDVEGWTLEHDAQHTGRGMAIAASCYALPPSMRRYSAEGVPRLWPWTPEWWKPSDDRVRELVKAGALIAAEIDRLQRGEA